MSFDISLESLYPAAWNAFKIAGALATLLEHEEKGSTLDIMEW